MAGNPVFSWKKVRTWWVIMAAVLLVLLACLGTLSEATTMKPNAPCANLSPEQRNLCIQRLREQYNRATRQRFGKRDLPEEPVWNQLLPDGQDRPVESR